MFKKLLISSISLVLVSCGGGDNNSTNIKESVLYAFTNAQIQNTSLIDGNNPQASLVLDSLGNLYGTTYRGGTIGAGTVFKLTPNGSGNYTESILYSFQYNGTTNTTDGLNPNAALTIDSSGNLYGTTVSGGSVYGGVIFKLMPNGSGGYSESIINSSTSCVTTGCSLFSKLLIDSSGNLYGTAYQGGANSSGTVFKLSPNGSGGYTQSVLYTFKSNGTADGALPFAGLAMDSSGNLYGTTTQGGTSNKGTVYKLTPNGSGGYSESVLYSFLYNGTTNITDGASPYADLVIDNSGNLYGTTSYGGTANLGTVFKLTPNSSSSSGYVESIVYSFQSGINTTVTTTTKDGATPFASLLMDNSGDLYGTTSYGGTAGLGTVFKLTPNSSSSSGYVESIVYSFQSGINTTVTTTTKDGANPHSALIMDTAGNLYGTTLNGGSTGNYGTVFKLN